MGKLILVLVSLAIPAPAMALSVVADLANVDPGTTQTVSIPAIPDLDVKIVNMAPLNLYTKKLVVRNIEVEALPSPAAAGVVAACSQLDALASATDEKKVPGLIDALREAPPGANCDSLRAGEVIAETVDIMKLPVAIQAGQEVVLTVERHAQTSPEVDKAVWTFVWTTGPRGAWRASYGFGFFEEDDEGFFSRAGNDEGTFIIQKKVDRGDLAIAPAVFFTWARESGKLSDWDHGPTGGLGFDLTKPVVFVGWQATYNQNFTLNGGVVARPETELEGMYEVGQILKENLTADQLEDDSSYGIAPFLGLSFRFSENPFGKAAGDAK